MGVATIPNQVFQAIRAEDDICACNILEQMDITQPTLSHHVKQLCAAGLISCLKEGRWMHYTVNKDLTKSLSAWFADAECPS